MRKSLASPRGCRERRKRAECTPQTVADRRYNSAHPREIGEIKIKIKDHDQEREARRAAMTVGAACRLVPLERCRGLPGPQSAISVARYSAYHKRMQPFEFLAATEIFGINLHPWKIVGLLGAAIFGARFVIQWLASERAKKSVIPFGFWECSALGSILTLSYFAIYQRDSVGVIQNLLPLPIYLRNLYFRYTRQKTKHPGNAERPPE
jgi:lipid-A-disaccharide synthase-like uncharacterized protein